METLRNLRLDRWYMVVMAAAVPVFGLALTVPLQVPNAGVALLSAGAFFFSLGEWVNHPAVELHKHFTGDSLRRVYRYPRVTSRAGVALNLLGIALVVAGVPALLR